jgi:transposase
MAELPSVHLPSKEARERRALLTSRAALVRSRTTLVNSVRGWARTQLLKIRGQGGTKTFPERARAAALEREHGLPVHIERTLQVLEALNAQIASADAELEALVEGDETCRKLMTVPGVGPITATAFQSALDDVTRFKHAHAVESYVGLTPGENSSGLRTQRLGITAAGSVRVRTALVQAAWCAYRVRPEDPMVQWARNVATRRPVQVAIVALARKLAGILYAIWRDGAEYSPVHRKALPTVAAP